MNLLTRAVFSCRGLSCGKDISQLTSMLEYFAFLGSQQGRKTLQHSGQQEPFTMWHFIIRDPFLCFHLKRMLHYL